MADSKKKILYPVIFMIAITIVFTALLATLNLVFADRIHQQSLLKEQASILYVFDIPHQDTSESVLETYQQFVEEDMVLSTPYYRYHKGGQTMGHAFKIQGAGLWGGIEAVLAFDPSFDHLLGITFLEHSETPGLGGRIDERWYQDQFRQIPLDRNAGTPYLIYRPATHGNVDAISGATSTSNAVLSIFNEEIHHILSVLMEEVRREP
jgi:Na+-transporting NADH:ubiquinone oxidoreductase subunit C